MRQVGSRAAFLTRVILWLPVVSLLVEYVSDFWAYSNTINCFQAGALRLLLSADYTNPCLLKSSSLARVAHEKQAPEAESS